MVQFPCARHEGIFGNGATTPLILNLVAKWRSGVSFANQPLHPVERATTTYRTRNM